MVDETIPNPVTNLDKKTTIPLKVRTRERVKGYGRKGESWDGLLNRIMDELAFDPEAK